MKVTKLASLLLAVILLTGVFLVSAAAETTDVSVLPADVYIATTGVDTNAGTEAAPVLSLNKALELVRNGGTIHIVDRYTAPADFVWKNHGKDVTITGGTLDLSQAGLTQTIDNVACKVYSQGDGVTFDNMTLVLADTSCYFANGHRLQVNENVTVSSGTLYLYGGSNGRAVSSTNVKLLGGNYEKIYGGGYKANVDGDVTLYVGNINPQYTATHEGTKRLYGGSYSGKVYGDIDLTIAGANVDRIFGGNFSGSAGSTGNITVRMSGGTAYSLYGGHYSATGTQTGDIDLTVTGGTIAQVFGANEKGSQKGDVTVNLVGGTITRRVFGGCYNEKETLGNFKSSYFVTGNVRVYLHEGVNFNWNSSETDLGLYAHSRYSPLFDEEKTYIYYVGTAAQTAQENNLGSKNLGMTSVMGSASAADTISVYAATPVKDWNIVLSDNIGANFRLDLPKAVADMSVLKVTVAGKTVSHDLSSYTPNAEGLYVVHTDVFASQMTENITLQLVVNGVECAERSFTVREYAETILNGAYGEKAQTLLKHTLNYGAAAQNYFDINTEDAANKGYEIEYTAQFPAEYPQTVKNGQIDGIAYYGASLLIKEKITLRYYFVADSLEGVTFTANGAVCKTGQKNGMFYVDVPGINPHQYSESVLLCAVKGEQRLEVSYSPLYYMVRMSQTTDSEPLKKLLSAMYGYHESAVIYVADTTASVTLPDVTGGKVTSNKTSYLPGQTVMLTVTPDAGYDLVGLTVKKDGTNVDLGQISVLGGTYTFVAEKGNYTVECQFQRRIFNENAQWDLTNQYQETVTVNGVEALKGVASLPGGGSSAVAFREQFTDIDLTIKAKENKATTATNGGRTDILFEFENGRNVSFGIVKWSENHACVVETLGINNAYNIVNGRKTTLYKPNTAETEAYLTDGIELRVMRSGTDVYVFFEGKQVAVFDLTQNNSGVTADMKATVSLRHYDAIADEVVIPFAVTDKAVRMTFKDTYDANIWDISGQYDGYVTVIGGGGSGKPLQFAGMYQNVDLTLNARDYADSDTASRTEFGFEFDVDGDGKIDTAKGDQTVTFGIAQGDRIQTRGGTLLSWKTPYDLNAAEKAQLTITAEEVAAGNEDGLDLRVIRYGTMIYLFVENRQVAVCDLTKCANSAGDTASGVTADTKMFVFLRHYDDTREAGVKIPFAISTEVEPVQIAISAANGTASTAATVNHYVNNGRTTTTSNTHFLGEKITLTAAAASEEYLYIHTKLNGKAVTLTDGTYTFTATEDRCEIECVFRKKLFVDNADAAWDLSQQNLGTITVDGIEKTQGIATLLKGGSKAVAFRDKYTAIDITVMAKENDTTGKKPGRTDILFEFDNGKNVSFGVTCTKPADKTCWVQTLGISTNHIPATRVNGLYKLSEAEAEKYLSGGGVELRVVRDGINVYVFLEGKQVAVFDLTQNNSGVTADMPAKLSLRHYDAVADVVIPFTVTAQTKRMIFKDTYDASIWDISGQGNGLVVLPNGGGTTATPLEFSKKFKDVDISLVARDYADEANTAARTDLEYIFDNGESVTFSVVYNGGSYRIQTRAGTLLNWKTPYFITDQSMIDDYVVTAEEMSSGNPGGLDFRVIRYGTEFYLYLNGTMVKGYDFSYKIAADTSVTVYLRHYDDAGVRVEIPFTVSEEVTVDDLRLFAEKEAVTDYAYSFAVIPDIQIVTENDVKNGQNNLAKLFDWIVANKESKNIQFAFGLGDITDNNNEAEWTLAKEQHAKLSTAGIPYSVVRGNHDLPGYGGGIATDAFTAYMGTDVYRAQFEGFYESSNVANAWRTLTVGDVKYLMLTLDYGADDDVLNWASAIIYQHPDHNVIITTHAYLFRDGTTMDEGDIVPPSTSGGSNDGDDMWEKLVSKHENIVLVMSGHDPSESIVVNRSQGDNGNTVTAMLIDAQDVEAQEGSMGMVAMLYFSADGKTVQVEYYSTAKEKYFMSGNQFTVELDAAEAAGESTVPATGAYTTVALSQGSSYTTTIDASQRVTLSETPYTLSAWINVPKSTTAAPGVIFGNYSGSFANCLNFEISTNGNPRLYHRNASNTYDSLIFTSVDVRSNTEWVYLAFTISGNKVSCYVNGVLKQTLTAAKTIQLESTNADFIVGGDLRSGNAKAFSGKILKLDLYSGILSAEKILDLYVNGTEAVTEGKIAF